MNAKTIVAVGLGGTIGAISRYGIALAIPLEKATFPYATLIANLIGCLLLSYVLNRSVIKEKIGNTTFTALTTGVIGSFTTFSTFAVETVTLFQTNIILSSIYVFSNMLGGLLFCFLGYKVASIQRRATV
ncbi:CrcB protein [Oceanobacillus limi]|uniref:Fluoride-specific ion channel FluC n=1 Tax=Oceanobacillus limi TaxID=930131 RepID=A0A1I0DSU0_9BACI|nr:CrcB family protein [Oceanobacillus limi]SET35271.1 CrcB protein [Oceanobacillus limi]